MRKILTMSNCADKGFTVDHYDCISLAVAAMTTHYNLDFYDYYCGSLSMAQNWNEGAEVSFDARCNTHLRLLSLELIPVNFIDMATFFEVIKDCIDNSAPLLMMPKYNAMFYSVFYKESMAHLSHGMIISGYDSEKGLLFLQENVHLTEYNNLGTKGTPFFTFALTIEMLYEIWSKSTEQQESGKDIIFKLVRHGECLQEASSSDLLSQFVSLDLTKENQMAEYIKRLNSQLESNSINNETTPIFLRRAFVNSLEALLRIYDLSVSKLIVDESRKVELIKEKESFVNKRNIISNKILKAIVGRKTISGKNISEYADAVIQSDIDFQVSVSEVLCLSENQKSIKVNYARGCKAWADSERGFPRHYKASAAVNGVWIDGKDWDCWFSTAYQPEHWWKVDLGEERRIDEIVIRHFQGAVGNMYLVDYEISGSTDDITYSSLIVQKDNDLAITRYTIAPASCRYFMVTVSKPSKSGYLAAILEFEAWGIVE